MLDAAGAPNVLTVPVSEDPSGTLMLSLTGTSFDPANSTFNATSATLGINSPTPAGGSENSALLDFDAAEQLFISFNLDVFIENVDLGNLSGAETSTAGPTTGINDANTPTTDIVDFTGGCATPGFFLPAGTTFLLETTGPVNGSVGISEIHVALAAIPEPSSLALLAGLSGFWVSRRRRR